MLNTEDFVKRLEILLDYYSLNASSFADKIGVQRSSISHLLSGRNKPSLDFIMKITAIFPDINIYWILNGKEDFFKKDAENRTQNPKVIEIAVTPTSSQNAVIKDLFDTTEVKNIPVEIQDMPQTSLNQSSEIYKIVIFYKNGTFRDFVNDNK
jgi:transcriptional regulator with XRE-family HTH domain